MTNKPLFLISNDDGYFSPGISILSKIAQKYGNVVVVAPDSPQSGQSSALTVENPIRAKLLQDEPECKIYSCTGRPVDCIKLAINELLDCRPDFILSGVNHGANASVNVLYSGTMGVALEGAVVGIPAIGFSVTSHAFDFDFSNVVPFFDHILKETLRVGLPEGTCLNVNAPEGAIKGIRVCRQSKGCWEAEFSRNKDPRGQEYYWLTGNYMNGEPHAQDTDVYMLKQGYVSIVPTRSDMTDYEQMKKMNEEFKIVKE